MLLPSVWMLQYIASRFAYCSKPNCNHIARNLRTLCVSQCLVSTQTNTKNTQQTHVCGSKFQFAINVRYRVFPNPAKNPHGFGKKWYPEIVQVLFVFLSPRARLATIEFFRPECNSSRFCHVFKLFRFALLKRNRKLRTAICPIHRALLYPIPCQRSRSSKGWPAHASARSLGEPRLCPSQSDLRIFAQCRVKVGKEAPACRRDLPCLWARQLTTCSQAPSPQLLVARRLAAI